MCGIAGKFNFEPDHPVDDERLRAMTGVIAHREPDADGFFIGRGIGLGHRRLSIIDLATGDQPLANEDGSVRVVFNGEIYNFAEVRADLEALGHRFRTHSDTEVIVHGYEQWREGVVERLRGMFAIALWDEPRRRLRLVSDVPLGAFLSGGIDSSIVVAAMADTCATRVVTTSVGFDERAFDELASARIVAEHFGTESHEKIVRPDIADLLPKLAWHLDEPFADSSAVPTYYVSKAAREDVTVALSGDGGDELWAGYARHKVERWEAAARGWLGASGGRLAGRLAGRLPLALRGARSLRHLALPPSEACARKHAYGLFDHGRESFYSHDFASQVAGADPFTGFRAAYEACPSIDPVDRALYVDVKTYLVDDIMTKVDKMSMAVSLEAREPLLDHKLLEFAATVPSSLKLKNGRGKHLLRRLLERRIPTSIVDRPKHGFEAPIR